MQLRQKADMQSSVYRVPDLGPPDQEAVEEGWQGLWLEASEGAAGQVVMG